MIASRTEIRLQYRELGRKEGFGYTHFSRQTSIEVEKLIEASQQEHRVKSIFGEGVSPRLRKLRVGFAHVGLPSLSQRPLALPSPRKAGEREKDGANRVLNEQVLADVEKHTLIYPIEHGARVKLPESDEPTLFSFDE